MEFDTKQIATQILAFLLMLWILKRFAWTPLMRLMDERTEKIRSGFAEIEQKQREADARLEEYDEKIRGIKHEGQLLIQEAVKEGRRISQDIQQQAHVKAQAVLAKAAEEAALEKAKAYDELKRDMMHLSVNALEKLVKVKLTDQERERYAEEMLKEVQ